MSELDSKILIQLLKRIRIVKTETSEQIDLERCINDYSARKVGGKKWCGGDGSEVDLSRIWRVQFSFTDCEVYETLKGWIDAAKAEGKKGCRVTVLAVFCNFIDGWNVPSYFTLDAPVEASDTEPVTFDFTMTTRCFEPDRILQKS